MLKLDLGAAGAFPDGFTPLGNAHGSAIYPLPYADGSVDEIRASHVLEHFPHREVAAVLADWARALKPGGKLRIAVPDFGKIAEQYVAGANMPTEAYVMGGQIDGADHHKSLFDETKLKRALKTAGLMMIRPWTSELQDCAALPISLNLEGVKPFQKEMSVAGCMSVPRLGFMDNMFCAIEALPPLGVTLRRHSGAFWGQCLERCMEEAIEQQKPDLLLAIDYDTVFLKRDLATLIQLMMTNPHVDALAPVQSARGKPEPLFTMRAADGQNEGKAPISAFAGDLTKVATAHFGLTLIRADKLRALPKPWFHGQPAEDGTWGDGRVDDDIAFWRKWHDAGNTLFIANRVPVGHMELTVRWPGRDLGAIHQPINEWRKSGAPQESWK